jgi:hypothetical protein
METQSRISLSSMLPVVVGKSEFCSTMEMALSERYSFCPASQMLPHLQQVMSMVTLEPTFWLAIEGPQRSFLWSLFFTGMETALFTVSPT